ncbi:tail completion protein gp17 [Mangrovicoccus algicola]|uniref:DUF3168 domain-containing protein n=1 Tax=Mangrovicoccus algicola TaxID=2771008 RepID=A0A8J7CW84_9RHOB|nr:DUF3168 domain-containing protein [Mangrovicoccus algicola]MBE3637467.1 DUF3168 domain-containing protein [Mangrovicoccus algicola]
MKADLIALIRGLPQVAALAGDRVHWGSQPVDATKMPHVALTMVSAPHGYSLDGDTGLHDDIVQADLWAETAAEAEALRVALVAGLSGWSGTLGGTHFRSLRILGGRSLDGRGSGTQKIIHGNSVDLRVRWRAAP